MGFKKRDKVQKHKQSLEQHITNPDGEVGRSAPRAQKKRRRGDDEEEGDEARCSVCSTFILPYM